MRSHRRGSVKAILVAMLFCGGALVGAGYYFKGDSGGQPTADPLAWAQEQASAFTGAQNVAPSPAKPAATPAKGVALAQAPKAETKEEGGDLPSAQEPASKEPAAKTPLTKTPPPKTGGVPDTSGTYTADQKAALLEIRQAMSDRDLPAAKAAIEKAEKLGGDEGFKKELSRLLIFHDHLVQFWTAVDKGGQYVHTKDEITIGTTLCSVVEYSNETLIIRVDGVNKRYHLKEMGLKMALVLASHALKVDAAVNKVIVASFLTMDRKGDREQAKKYFEDGKRAGLDVDDLLPELGVTGGPAQLNVPSNLPPALKAQLALANWQLRKSKGSKVARGPLPPVGRSSALGQLILNYDAALTDPAWTVQRQRLAGDFKYRMILDDVKDGQVIGVFSADDKDQGYYAPIPAGVVHVEFSRKKDVYECSVNGSPVEVQKIEGTPANMPGLAGISLPPGTNCTLAYFEFVK